MKDITITIDGPAGSGKGTTAKGVVDKLGYKYLDTGAMYRAVALALSEQHIRPTHTASIEHTLPSIELDFDENNHIKINGDNREQDIRTNTISTLASSYSTVPHIREWLVAQQQAIIADGGYVLDGRDAGSVIAPNAELKIYLDCDVAIRAKRRAAEYGITDEAGIESIKQDLIERDERDKNREISPLVVLPDSIIVDTSELTIDEQIDKVYTLAREIIDTQHE